MWRDNDDRIMDIDKKDKGKFPVICPICGKREGHLYYHRHIKNDARGGMWTWCSACRHTAHTSGRVPEWWENLQQIDGEKLASFPDYLEENKRDIDEWLNQLIMLHSTTN